MTDMATGEPLATVVYKAVSREILDGTLTPGTALVQEQLAAQYQVSRTPVRDALTQLTTNGLVQLVPSKGYFVNDLSRDDVSDVFAVRYQLESLAFTQAFGLHTPRQLHHLRMLAGEVRLASTEDASEVFEISTQFHRQLLEPCPNSYLLEVIAGVWAHPIQRRITLTYRPGAEHIERIASDHEALVQSLIDGDLQAGLRLLHRCNDPDDTRGAPLAR